MAKKLYVGNLPYSMSDVELRELFSKAGTIADAIVISDRETGRSKGFGFVEMESDEEAQEAMRRFNGYSINNRTLTVNEARPREERSGGGNRGGGGGYNNRDRY